MIVTMENHIDQHVSYYTPQFRSNKWAPKIFLHFDGVTTYNAYILKVSIENLNTKNYTHLDFIKAVIDQLGEQLLQSRMLVGAVDQLKRSMSRQQWEREPSRRLGYHFCLEITRLAPLLEVDNNGNTDRIRWSFRGLCLICKSRVTTQCKQCKVFLCNIILEGEDDKTCFETFHTEKIIRDKVRPKVKPDNF